jgi:glycosyltransferase involved in cell wall biosynthesis
MGFGLPIIIAKSPGNVDVVRNGKDALLYDGSISSLEEAMLKFINNQKIRESYSRKSRKRSKDFDWSRIVDYYITLYRK